MYGATQKGAFSLMIDSIELNQVIYVPMIAKVLD